MARVTTTTEDLYGTRAADPDPVTDILQDMQDLPAIERARDPYLKIKADLVEWEPPKIKPRSKRGQRTRRWR